jgi:hypothetical protein
VIIERRIGSQTVRADCSQAYARAAADVLNTFEKLAHTGTPLGSDTEIRFGWTLLRLTAEDNSLLITEPDFVNWPEQRWSRAIDTSLEVLAAQVRLLHRLDVDGQDAYYDQFVISAPGALAQSRVFLRREGSISAEDSGWLLGSVEDPEALGRESNLERIVIASLVQRRPALLQALALPPGFIVVFSGDSIEQIFDAGGRPLM